MMSAQDVFILFGLALIAWAVIGTIAQRRAETRARQAALRRYQSRVDAATEARRAARHDD